MVNLQGKESTALKTIQQSLITNLNIIASDSRLKTINDKIVDSRYTFKLIKETGTLPISSERCSLLYKNWLYIAGSHISGAELIIIDINTMGIVKQVSLSTVSGEIPLFILRDGTYYYINVGGSGSHVIKGLLETGEVLISKALVIGDTRGMGMDNDYLYTVDVTGKIYKIDKATITRQQVGTSVYREPSHLLCQNGYIYITGLSNTPSLGDVIKVSTTDISTVVATASNNIESTRLLIDGDYLYTASTGGIVKKWLLSDLSYINTFYNTNANNPIYTFKKALNNFWIGDSLGTTYRVSETGDLLTKIQTSNSANYVLEIDETNQILYRNASDDVTIAKYQIIDNLQNNHSTTVLKTDDLVTLNTAGVWVDNVYTLNDMSMTCNTLSNGHLRQLSFNGTTTADSTFILATPNVNNKLTPDKSYILNGVKSTDSLSTVFIRLTRYQNQDGSGLNKVTEKVAGDFKVFIAANDNYLYYKIEIVIKSGVTLTNSLYNNIPSIIPSSITYKQGEGPYLIKDLKNTQLNTSDKRNYAYKLDCRLFLFSTSESLSEYGKIIVLNKNTLNVETTISTSAGKSSTGFAYDDNFIYISVIKLVSTAYHVHINKYNRQTLAFIEQSPSIYSGSSPYVNVEEMLILNGFLFVPVNVARLVYKINPATWSVSTTLYFVGPLKVLKLNNTSFVLTGTNTLNNTDANYRKSIICDDNLNVLQVLPHNTIETTPTVHLALFLKNNFLTTISQSGLFTRYDLTTYQVVRQIQPEFTNFVHGSALLINDKILVRSKGVVYLYDLDFNLIKKWAFNTTTNVDGFLQCDENYIIEYFNNADAIVYKKQFIDMTEGVI